MTEEQNDQNNACGKNCACSAHQISRRDFLTLSAALPLAGLLGSTPLMAGPFEAPDFARLVPPDKKLRPEWVRSLFARGAATVYAKKRDELRFIGMPVGGACCGTVYLGGDGRLWVWDIFNQVHPGLLPGNPDQTNGANYVKPASEQSPLEQGFALKVGDAVRKFDTLGWETVEFEGQYPVGRVRYRDPASSVSAQLTAYSPFVPLQAEDSSLPAIVCEWTLENTGQEPVEAEIGGWLQNGARLFSGASVGGSRINAVQSLPGATLLNGRFARETVAPTAPRPDITVEDFQHAGYGEWKVEGTAFGAGPVRRQDVPTYQGDLGGPGDRVVNTHAAAPANDVNTRDAQIGTLTSPPFPVQRRFLTFWIGGGSNVDEVGLAVIVDGKIVRRAAGHNANLMEQISLNVAEFEGQTATIQIYDRATGAWGHVGVGTIVQSDAPVRSGREDADDGTLSMALLGAGIGRAEAAPDTFFSAPPLQTASKPASETLIGGLSQKVRLLPGKPQTVTFVLAWHFPNTSLPVKDAASGNHYAKRFAEASAVAQYVVREHPRLSHETKLWNATWYDSTLPYWFLDRTFVNISTLATSTAHRFGTGRFWGWEGVGCCEGTCTHVYHYGQAIGRVFPEIERDMRERVDFGVAFDKNTGMIGYRGENTGPAVDGQCGRILGVCREHQMSADDAFLRRLWPNVKLALEWVSRHDTDGDGLLEGAQENTLDAAWFGKIPWISSLYAAALRACQMMATDMGETEYAAQCGRKLAQTRAAIELKLFNGEYFVQLPEAGHEHNLGVYQSSHIDQVQGQSWAWQIGLGRILDRDKTVSALRALYKYNFAPDVGPFKAKNPAGRPYALAGDGGLLMATNPQDLPQPFGKIGWQTGYFNECMSGFEHQAASHMIAEGMVLEGLAITRAIHDRYHASRRNPYNEIECSDHYARAMASYGSFIAICGFGYHGPRGHLTFAPRITPDDFRAPFTVAEGWGTFSQQEVNGKFHAKIAMKHGHLRLSTLALTPPARAIPKKVTVHLGARSLPATHAMTNGVLHIALAAPIVIVAGQTLSASLEP